MSALKSFTEKSMWKLATINAISSAFIILIALLIENKVTKLYNQDGVEIEKKIQWDNVAITLGATFAASVCVFWLMYFIFGRRA